MPFGTLLYPSNRFMYSVYVDAGTVQAGVIETAVLPIRLMIE